MDKQDRQDLQGNCIIIIFPKNLNSLIDNHLHPIRGSVINLILSHGLPLNGATPWSIDTAIPIGIVA